MTRPIRRRALLAAALPAAIAAFALPSAASATNVAVLDNGTLSVISDSVAPTNNIHISALGTSLRVVDAHEDVRPFDGCVGITAREARCDLTRIRQIQGILLAGDDVWRSDLTTPTVVFGGAGNDTYVRGLGPFVSRVEFEGGTGIDQAFYGLADRGVTVTKDDRPNDGRPGLDFDNVRGDVEHLVGSTHGDSLNGGSGADIIDGFVGNDRLEGNGGDDQFRMGSGPDGADIVVGGANRDRVSYAQRTRPVTINLSAGGADDGEAGEGDEIREIEMAAGGQAGDTLKADRTLADGVILNGGGGIDTITGTDQADTLQGNPGRDTIIALDGDDRIAAKDNEADAINCGIGTDLVDADQNLEQMSNCETVRVGTLRLAPKTLRAEAGESARLRLSWRHPRAWGQLRAIELRLTSDGLPVGEIVIDPRRGRIAADGAVTLIRRDTRVTRQGKTVAARLTLRLDQSLAGQTLEAEVEATDRRDRGQLESDAGRIRVSG